MENNLSPNQIESNTKANSQEITQKEALIGAINTATPVNKTPFIHHTKNLYPVVRHILLVVFILFSIALIVLLMHQNGKSIYDNGI